MPYYSNPVVSREDIPGTCKANDCMNITVPSSSVWYNVGISHYSKSQGFSYIQIHDYPHCCSEQCAKDLTHSRLELHRSLPHGVHSSALNPDGDFVDELVRQNAEYSPLPVAWNTLPQIDALTGSPLSDDIYIPHVDRWNSLDDSGVQGGYQNQTGVMLGCSTLDGALQLAHQLVEQMSSEPQEYTPPVAPVTSRSRKI